MASAKRLPAPRDQPVPGSLPGTARNWGNWVHWERPCRGGPRSPLGVAARGTDPTRAGEPVAGGLCPVTPCLGFGLLLWCSLRRDSWADSIVCPDT